MRKIAYLGMDVHAKHCVLGDMDVKGNFKGTQSFPTSEKSIIKALKGIKAKNKYLTFEEGTLAYWAGQVAAPYVTEVIPCDPKENALIFLRVVIRPTMLFRRSGQLSAARVMLCSFGAKWIPSRHPPLKSSS